MKYFKNKKYTDNNQVQKKYLPVLFFVIIVFFSTFLIRDILYRSIYGVSLGSLYVEFLNEKAELINFFKNNKLNTIEFTTQQHYFKYFVDNETE